MAKIGMYGVYYARTVLDSHRGYKRANIREKV